uniref:Uncharacterized protein n=1 Tax=Octopus bimaculoides TaxID=37653 RepID=A0A0L8GJP3_OCTBM
MFQNEKHIHHTQSIRTVYSVLSNCVTSNSNTNDEHKMLVTQYIVIRISTEYGS